jgi:hypothetical protein
VRPRFRDPGRARPPAPSFSAKPLQKAERMWPCRPDPRWPAAFCRRWRRGDSSLPAAIPATPRTAAKAGPSMPRQVAVSVAWHGVVRAVARVSLRFFRLLKYADSATLSASTSPFFLSIFG